MITDKFYTLEEARAVANLDILPGYAKRYYKGVVHARYTEGLYKGEYVKELVMIEDNSGHVFADYEPIEFPSLKKAKEYVNSLKYNKESVVYEAIFAPKSSEKNYSCKTYQIFKLKV